MSTALSEVVKFVRLRHPAFTRETIPTVALAEALSDYQRELIKTSAEILNSLVVDRFTVAFDFGATDPAALLMTAVNFGCVTGVPAMRDHDGDGISLVAEVPTAAPAVDLTVRYEDGLVLPVNHKILGGTCMYAADGSSDASDPSSSPVFLGRRFGSEFHLVAFDQRMNPPAFPSGYVLDEKLYLTGQTSDWQGWAGIDIRYVPLPVNLTAEADTFRLPDTCRGALNAKAALVAAEWAVARGKEVDVAQFRQDHQTAEGKLLGAINDRQSQIVRTLKRNR